MTEQEKVKEQKTTLVSVMIILGIGLIIGTLFGRWTAPEKIVLEKDFVRINYQEEIDAYYLSKAQDTCKEHGGEWKNRLEKEYGQTCEFGDKIYLYQDHRLENRIPEKVEILEPN